MSALESRRAGGGAAARALAALLLASLLAGCADMPVIGKRTRADAFQSAAESYGKMLRWGYYDEAAKFLHARDGSRVDADLARVSRYRISSYQIGSQLLADSGREGRVVAAIEYYDIDSGVLHTLRDEQYWWYDDVDDRWYLGSPLPAFGLDGG